MRQFALLISTVGYLGYVPVAPGTVGSFVGLVLFFFLKSTGSIVVELGAVVLLLVVGVWASTVAERYFDQVDPAPVVIDETVGMLITLALLPVNFLGAFIGFLVFRVLDVTKPFPVASLEKLPRGFGIMADDGMAAVYGNLIMRGLLAVAPNWLS
jgi:phosphatidylglycerophosphatase A